MILEDIDIKNFRSVTKKIKLSNKITLVIGPNGKGKTNLIEAIYMLARGEGFRTQKDKEAIDWNYKDEIVGQHFFKVTAQTKDGLGNSNKLEYLFEENKGKVNGRKTLKINGKRKSKKDFTNYLSVIIFSPLSIDLVTGSPSVRRDDLDYFVSIIKSDYIELINNYKRVLRNRNKLLEKAQTLNSAKEELVFWNERLIDYGSRIIFERNNTINLLNPSIKEQGEKILNHTSPNLELRYDSKYIEKRTDGAKEIKERLKCKIQNSLEKEIYTGQSLYGPHREDYSISLNNKNLRSYGSRGQQRLAVFIIKLAEWDYLKKNKNNRALFLLDDLFSELDRKHREKVSKVLEKIDTQIVITLLEEKNIPEILHSGKNKKVIL